VNLNRKIVASAITIVIAIMTLSVTYHGIATGVGIIPGMSFLVWTLIALIYTTQEEIGEYVRKNHKKITVPAEQYAARIINWTQKMASQEQQRRLRGAFETSYDSAKLRLSELTDQLKNTIDHVIEEHL
jgi:ABC-type transport system involved in cytochrome bd biosynthesis fused ATPase/permease subunit